MKQLNVSSPDSLLELGYFDTEDIMATENFYLTDTGICWVYNPYEIACYATANQYRNTVQRDRQLYFTRQPRSSFNQINSKPCNI